MRQKRLGKRITTWFLCLAMVMTTINLPVFTSVVKAADLETPTIFEIWDGHHVKYDSQSKEYICVDTDCYDTVSPGYYDADGNSIEYGSESLVFFLMGNLTSYDSDFGFSGCSNLTTVDLGSLTSYEVDFGFGGCPNLTTVDLGSLTSYDSNFGFWRCEKLTTVDLGSLILPYVRR